ncbi:DUF2989 domain-containing protein [Shewanella intestini]|uniref:DUF2989 domain-containing protein n=1 Tax=Shewanella intestini TaxID=2017544 RepID=A0ABS5I2K4_9GAMM|nr:MULTISPECIES: DUF2989 domain-containing protein [Shewanella]MBR9727919.1 DUF2989 domain-containing protein [Shewanella intestini]MRG36088.1 DUF2989 domain-containing protein [Shewanella sp. XMDDZSB0408]
MNKKFVIITSIGMMGLIFGLFGCEKPQNSDYICKNNPELCADLHKDSWCRFEKGDLIRHRYHLLSVEKPHGKDLYLLLRYLEKYSQCMEMASGVKHVMNTHRTEDRERAYAISTQTLAQLQEYTKNDTDVYLAYYRWTRFNDDASREIVLAAYRNNQITEPEQLASLATYYVRYSPNDAKKLYLKLFSLDDPENFDTNWLLGLASIFHQQQQLQWAYLLTKTNLLMTDNKADDHQLMGLVNGNKQTAETLNTKAKMLASLLQSGHFSQSELATQLKNI